MDMDLIMQFINTCAFPIVMCILFYTKMSSLIEEFTKAFNSLSETNNKLIDRIDRILDDKE